jgi:hypothetical protein
MRGISPTNHKARHLRSVHLAATTNTQFRFRHVEATLALLEGEQTYDDDDDDDDTSVQL